MFNSGEFSKILDEIFEKDEKEKEKAIKIYCKIWKHLENITLQNLKYKRAFEILKEKLGLEIKNVNNLGRTLHKLYYGDDESTLEQEEYELLEELMKDE